MKMLPIPLSLSGPQLGLWSDVLWRYPQAPPSPLAELKTQLPPQLHPDPRLWGREDVTVFLRFCEREFDLPKFELDLFQMNGKALCLLTRTDFGERCPGAGDVLHNVLQMLIRESQMMQRHLPSSPVTPTSRYPLSPHSHPPTPNWASLAPPDNPFHSAHLHHFMQPNSVTLSPAPSIDSQASSPPQNQSEGGNGSSSSNSSNGGSSNHNGSQNVFNMNHQNNSNHHHNANSSSSNQSDSDEDSFTDAKQQIQNISPPTTPVLKDLKPNLSQQITNVVNSWSSNNHNCGGNSGVGNNSNISLKSESNGPGGGGNGGGGSISAPSTPGAYIPVKREFFPDSPEPNTNGRLLWDFLQQLLNDPAQRYSNYIAWKCRDTGVFKIVDPAGLARLWGIQKNHLSMNYDKMSRALRYYYRVNILRKVQGERHCYQFLRNPTELKNIKNISLLRQSIVNSSSSSSSSSTSSSTSSNTSSNGSTNSLSAAQQQQQQQNTQQSHHHHLQQQQQQQQLPPQLSLPSSQQSNQLGPSQSLPQLPSQTMSPPAISSSGSIPSPSPYGPPPTSPLIMHAINGAFHYLSTSAAAQPPPHSPVLPTTPCEKLQFNNLKIEGNNGQDNDDMEPTDLSVGGDRRYNNNNNTNNCTGSTNGDCYPLIRNSDGLTTIKLIRSYENSSPHKLEHITPAHRQPSPQPPHSSSPSSQMSNNGHQSPVHAMQCSSSPRPENDEVNVDDCLMPTDLRK